MAKLEIRCPVCAKWDNIEILEDATKDVKKGLLAVNIAPGMICDHSFIAYVDKNLTVRDCFIADFKIEAPEADPSQKKDKKSPPEAGSIKIDLIRMNVPEKLLVFILKAIFIKKKIILLSDDQFLYNHVINFFRFVMQDLFDFDMLVMSEGVYKKTKKLYDDYIIFKENKVIHDNNKIIDKKKLKVEKGITQKFLAEYELAAGLIILKNEIQKAYEFSEDLAEFISGTHKEALTTKLLIDHINEKRNEQIQKDYLTFLLDIVKNYFKVEIPNIDGVTDFLDFF